MIIEFCGVPGCGKTTISNELIKRLKDKNEEKPFYDRLRVLDRNNCVIRTARRLDRHFYKIYSVGSRKKMIDLIESNAMHDSESERKYIYRLLELSEAVRHKSKYDLILDEGFIQYISSLAYQHRLVLGEGADRLIDAVFPDLDDHCIINCEIPIDVATKRLQQRNRKREHDRYNIDDIDLQRKIMSVKSQNIDLLLSHPKIKKKHILNINMLDGMEKNVEAICSFIDSDVRNEK